MGKQVIISISREYGSGGHEIARHIAEKFNLPMYDHNLLDEIAAGKCSVKNMRTGEQITVTPAEAAAHIKAGLTAGDGPIILEK